MKLFGLLVNVSTWQICMIYIIGLHSIFAILYDYDFLIIPDYETEH